MVASRSMLSTSRTCMARSPSPPVHHPERQQATLQYVYSRRLASYFDGSPATGRPRQIRNPSRESEYVVLWIPRRRRNVRCQARRSSCLPGRPDAGPVGRNGLLRALLASRSGPTQTPTRRRTYRPGRNRCGPVRRNGPPERQTHTRRSTAPCPTARSFSGPAENRWPKCSVLLRPLRAHLPTRRTHAGDRLGRRTPTPLPWAVGIPAPPAAARPRAPVSSTTGRKPGRHPSSHIPRDRRPGSGTPNSGRANSFPAFVSRDAPPPL